jgi:hypothetical protein
MVDDKWNKEAFCPIVFQDLKRFPRKPDTGFEPSWAGTRNGQMLRELFSTLVGRCRFGIAVNHANSPLSFKSTDKKVDAITDNHRGSDHQQNCKNRFGDDETTQNQKHAANNDTNA